MILILGAGLAGLSASYHLGHDKCVVLEQHAHPFGHVASERREGFTWDQGPHVSFTKHEYVRRLFQESVGSEFSEIEVQVGNYYHGHWVTHPAQTALHQVPEPERSQCLASFLHTRDQATGNTVPAANCQEWLERAFGPVFANTFPSVYTRKYWTRAAADLTTDWIGNRILYPEVEDVKRGAQGELDRSMHYITKVRYPTHGGYQSFATGLRTGSNIQYGAHVVSIDLDRRVVRTADGRQFAFETLVNTLPLPVFINACVNVPSRVTEAAQQLTCTQFLLVNIAAPRAAPETLGVRLRRRRQAVHAHQLHGEAESPQCAGRMDRRVDRGLLQSPPAAARHARSGEFPRGIRTRRDGFAGSLALRLRRHQPPARQACALGQRCLRP